MPFKKCPKLVCTSTVLCVPALCCMVGNGPSLGVGHHKLGWGWSKFPGEKMKNNAVVVATKTVGFMLKNDTRLAACNFILSNSWCKSQVNLWLWYGTLRINVNMDTHKLCQHMSWWLGWITTQERNEAHLASASRKWSNISNYFQGLPNINQ